MCIMGMPEGIIQKFLNMQTAMVKCEYILFLVVCIMVIIV